MSALLMFRDETKVSVPWRYIEPKTGTKFGFPDSKPPYDYYATLSQLIVAVNLFLRENQLERPKSLAYVIEDQICRGLPARQVKERPVKAEKEPAPSFVQAPGGARSKIFQRVMTATHTIYAKIVSGEKFAEPHIVGKRARICAGCPMLKESGIGKCPTCLEAVRMLAGGNRHDFDGPLDGMECGICDCFVTAKIHYPIRAIAKGTRPEHMALFDEVPDCWVRSGIRSLPKELQPDYVKPKEPTDEDRQQKDPGTPPPARPEQGGSAVHDPLPGDPGDRQGRSIPLPPERSPGDPASLELDEGLYRAQP